jgi:lipopolysaccharide export system permease protein
MVFALFSFILYYNVLNLGQSWIANGKVSFLPFLLVLHGGVFGLSLLLLAKQHNHWSLFALRRRQRSLSKPRATA